MGYANATLTSLDGDLSVVVYLPFGVRSNQQPFYYSSRFDHGSMIGSIERKTRTFDDRGKERVKTHVLFGSGMWREPHNEHWPESGIGIASEFGVGDDGAFCYYRCGWQSSSDISNGVLGYMDAKNGESFLKIGVGELVKGTCPACDSAEDYRFNSPYLFARPPYWKLLHESQTNVKMEHMAKLNSYGYKLVKEVNLIGNVLTVTSTLVNLGDKPFATAWYSHNFFTCDSIAVGPGYSIDLNIRGDRSNLYDEPGTWSWSTPLKTFADVTTQPNLVDIKMTQALQPGVMIKSEFTDDGATNGGFTIRACGTSIVGSIPEVESNADISMYGYNLYIERGTLSPEPQLLIRLNPGEGKTWTQQLVIGDIPSDFDNRWRVERTFSLGSDLYKNHASFMLVCFGLVCSALLTTFHRGRSTRRRRQLYLPVPDEGSIPNELENRGIFEAP